MRSAPAQTEAPCPSQIRPAGIHSSTTIHPEPIEHGPDDAALPAGGDVAPLEQEAGMAAVAAGHQRPQSM